MKMIGLMVLFVGFLPAYSTAMTTDGYLTFIDYVSVFLGFFIGGLLMELRYEH